MHHRQRSRKGGRWTRSNADELRRKSGTNRGRPNTATTECTKRGPRRTEREESLRNAKACHHAKNRSPRDLNLNLDSWALPSWLSSMTFAQDLKKHRRRIGEELRTRLGRAESTRDRVLQKTAEHDGGPNTERQTHRKDSFKKKTNGTRASESSARWQHPLRPRTRVGSQTKVGCEPLVCLFGSAAAFARPLLAPRCYGRAWGARPVDQRHPPGSGKITPILEI